MAGALMAVLGAVMASAQAQLPQAPRSDAQLRAAMMTTHNAARKDVGMPPLQWDAKLAEAAARYAQTMARNNSFQHDPQTGVSVRQGENLWMGTRGYFPYAHMSGGWIDEKRYFKRGAFPNSSTSGNWSDVGHYTQIIWATTTRVGCALASNRDFDYLVCRYSPAGNMLTLDPLKG